MKNQKKQDELDLQIKAQQLCKKHGVDVTKDFEAKFGMVSAWIKSKDDARKLSDDLFENGFKDIMTIKDPWSEMFVLSAKL